MRHFVVAVLMVALGCIEMLPLAAQTERPQQAAAVTRPQTVVGADVVRGDAAGVSGIVVTADGQPLGNTAVRARNLVTNAVAGSTRTDDKGSYTILNLRAGNYVLEIVDDEGTIIGTSAFVAATPGSFVSGLNITAGVLNNLASETGLIATLGGTAARSLTAAAAAAGVAGVVIPPDVPVASPSR
jgi:hypothetical protein